MYPYTDCFSNYYTGRLLKKSENKKKELYTKIYVHNIKNM